MDANWNRNTPLGIPDFMDAAQVALPPLPDRFLNTPWPDMPEKMLVTLDGWHDTPKALVGEWVANALGGLFVNSDQIYRSLVAACAKSGVDVGDYARVQSWCERAGVDIGFAKGSAHALEAQVAVGGQWFAKTELESVGELVSTRAACHTFWDKVRQVLRRCDFDDRVVIVGSDVGHEFPRTPYKFFLDCTGSERNPIELAGLAYPWLAQRRNSEEPTVTFFDHGSKSLVVDVSRVAPADLVVVVLVESVARACEMGFIGGRRDAVLSHAYFLADAVRSRMKTALAKRSI